jgi:hypothetical protein
MLYSNLAAARIFFSLVACVSALMVATPVNASMFYRWQTVTLSPSTGASCGNGTPYRFFVNRALFTSKTVVVLEGGGACWAQDSCLGKGGLRGASNPNGISVDYMTKPIGSTLNGGLAFGGMVTPFSARLHPLQRVQTQGWNMVYMPYCSGDVHTGNQINIYRDSNPAAPLAYYHRGHANSKAVAEWLKQNMAKPAHLLVTGFSAGGVGATAQYDTLRRALMPAKSALLADSGPLMQAPRNADSAVYPSVRLHNLIRERWGYDQPSGIMAELAARYPGRLDPDNLGSVGGAMARLYPQDRMSYLNLQKDAVFSGFSYEDFYPDIKSVSNEGQRKAAYNELWVLELKRWVGAMESLPNVGYYVPYERNLLQSHTLTTLSFAGTAIPQYGYQGVGQVVDDLLDRQGVPIRAFQTDNIRPVTPMLDILTGFLSLFRGLQGQ